MKSKESGAYLIMYLTGRLDVTQAAEIEKELDETIKNTKLNLLLNLEGVDYMSSSGVRIFVATTRTLKESNRILRLCNLPSSVKRVFQMMELGPMFPAFESEEEALAAE